MSSKKTVKNSVRAHIYFEGRVQGVGFRYTAERIAQDLGLVGWVKNLPDGRVEILCEGPKETVERLLHEIKDGMLSRHIRKTQCSWRPATNEFTEFRIEFSY